MSLNMLTGIVYSGDNIVTSDKMICSSVSGRGSKLSSPKRP